MEMGAYDMINHLKEMFQEKARIKKFNTVRSLLSCKLAAGHSVSPHVLKMKGHLDDLDKLGLKMEPQLAADIILNSLPEAYDSFILNYNMHNMEKTVLELHGMLTTAEKNIKSNTKDVLLVNKGKGMKKVAKGKGKGKASNGSQKSKAKPKPKAKAEPKPKEGICFFCNKPGHWKRNCKLYLDDLKKKKDGETAPSGIHVIELNLSDSSFDSWVLDTGSGSHICTNVQGLKSSRSLAKGEVYLRVGNGARVAALSVGTYELSLPSGLVLSLENCYYVPTIRRNIISISCLDKKGFEFIIRNNKCDIYLDNIFYGNAPCSSGLYVLDTKATNETPIYNVETKKSKSNDLNSTYL